MFWSFECTLGAAVLSQTKEGSDRIIHPISTDEIYYFCKTAPPWNPELETGLVEVVVVCVCVERNIKRL